MKLILTVVGWTTLVVAVAVTAASLAYGSEVDQPTPDRLARDTDSRAQLKLIVQSAHFHVHAPKEPPSGYLFDAVIWDPGDPYHGFAVWMRQAVGQQDRGIHIIEAPVVLSAVKNTLHLPGLTPRALSNGTWQVLQKSDAPWQGLWIYAIELDGVHIEVDGANRQLVESVASGL